MATYTQCELQKIDGDASIVELAWIPSEFGKLGKKIKIKKSGKWDDGWKVVRVYSFLSSNIVEARSSDYRKMSTFKE